MVEIADTPDGSISDTCEVWRDFADAKFDIFSVISHANKGLYDRLVFWWIKWFWSFFSLWCWDVLEGFCIERSTEFHNDFAGKFWPHTNGLSEALGFPACYCLHNFILSEVEESECSFWSETIDAEELSKQSFFFIIQKSY